MIWSVASARSNWRRSAWLRSTATCLNDWISSPARWRLATSWSAAAWLRRDELVEPRAAQRRLLELVGEHLAAPREARRHGEADADGIVDLVGDAGDEAAERGELLRLDQVLLGVAQLGERVLGVVLGGAQLLLGLALGDRVVAEHLDGARHVADLVARRGAVDRAVVAAVGDVAHRRHQPLQRPPDALRRRRSRPPPWR